MVSGTSSDLNLRVISDVGGNIGSTIGLSLTTTWARFVCGGTLQGGARTLGIKIEAPPNVGPTVIYAWGAQLQYGDAASDFTETDAAAVELAIADPFWVAAESGTPGAALGFNSRFPKRGRQIVRHGSVGWDLAQIGQTDKPLMGRTLIHSGYMKEHYAITGVRQLLCGSTSGGLFVEESEESDQTLTAAWQRFSVGREFGGRQTNWQIAYRPLAVGTFYLFGPQLSESPALVDYRRSGSAQEGEAEDWAAFIDDAIQGNAVDY